MPLRDNFGSATEPIGGGREESDLAEHWHLPQLDWLRELTAQEREKLRAASTHRLFHAGEIIFMPVHAPDSIFLLEEGLVRIYRLSQQGLEGTLGYVKPGEVFGELTVIDDFPRESFAQAVEPSWVWRIPRRAFKPYVESRPRLVLGITKQIGQRMKRIENRVENLVFRDVASRVALTLLELAEHVGLPREDGSLEIGVQITQAELGTLIGATRQTVNESLRELEASGLITHEGRHIVIKKTEELRQRVLGSE